MFGEILKWRLCCCCLMGLWITGGSTQGVGIECPNGWATFKETCYRFVRSPVLTWFESQSYCRRYGAELLSLENPEEHDFISEYLRLSDPTVSIWYTSGYDALSTGEWIWTSPIVADRRISNDDTTWIFHGMSPTEISNYVDPALTMASPLIGRALAYNFSSIAKTWGWLSVIPDRSRPFICELPLHLVIDMPSEERELDYGLLIDDPDEIPSGPVIIEEPVDAVFDTTAKTVQNWITIRCTASGYPVPEYTWHRINYENGQEAHYLVDPLSDANYTQTDGSLTTYNPEPSRNRGEYYCTATNRYGSAISKRISIRFGYIGDFALRREATQLVLFNGGVVPCDAPTHFPSVVYVWARDAFPNFVEENKRIFVSKDGNLYFSHVETSDEGTYQCIVKSTVAELGKTGPFFQVNVRREHSIGQLKIFSSFPKLFPMAPIAGDDVSLECLAAGYPSPTYQWRRLETEVLPQESFLKKANRVLHIPNVQISDSGEYECRASSSQGSVSAVISVEINMKPTFLVPLKAQLVDAGVEVTWTCAAFGRPAVVYRWYKNGQLLDPGKMPLDDVARYQIDQNRLTIREAQDPRDNGMIQCEARNVLGSAFSTGELRVVSFAPTFRKQPMESFNYAIIGGNLTILCQPEAAPRPSIRWLFNNLLLLPTPRHRILGNGNLVINEVHPTDQGIYTCEATNPLGTDRSTSFLQVLRGSRMLEVPVNGQIPFNGSAIMRCTADTDPLLDIAYEWRLNGLPISMEENDKFYMGWKERRGYLFIRDVTFSEAGDYTCIVRTPVVTTFFTARLDVIGAPGPPSGLSVVPLGLRPNSVVLRWADGILNGPKIIFYRLEALTNQTNRWFVLIPNLVPSRALLFNHQEVDLLDQLQPWNSYRFRLSAGNFLGWSDPSPPSAAYDVPPAPPTRPPLGISGGGGKPGSLVITWNPFPPQEQNGPAIGYRILFRKLGSDGDFQEEIVNGDKGRAIFNVGDEFVYQPFEVQIRAFNIMGDGPISPVHIVHSAETPPVIAPVNVRGIAFNATAINVTWAYPSMTTPENLGGRLLGHRVKYWRRGWDEEDAWTVMFKRVSSYTEEFAIIKGLEPFTEYLIAVMGTNSAGNGPQSEISHARTYRSEPREFPMGVRVRVRDWNSIVVDWRGIMTTPQEEPILGYKVRYWRQGEHIKSALDLVLPLDMLNGKLEAVLGGLVPEESYNLRVLGYSQGGDGRMSSPVWQFKMAIASGAGFLDSCATLAFWSPLVIFVTQSMKEHCLSQNHSLNNCFQSVAFDVKTPGSSACISSNFQPKHLSSRGRMIQYPMVITPAFISIFPRQNRPDERAASGFSFRRDYLRPPLQ